MSWCLSCKQQVTTTISCWPKKLNEVSGAARSDFTTAWGICIFSRWSCFRAYSWHLLWHLWLAAWANMRHLQCSKRSPGWFRNMWPVLNLPPVCTRLIQTDFFFYSVSVCPCCTSRAGCRCVFVSVLLQSAVTCSYTLSVPVRVNIPLLATSGLKAPILSELLEAFTELDKRGKAAALPD